MIKDKIFIFMYLKELSIQLTEHFSFKKIQTLLLRQARNNIKMSGHNKKKTGTTGKNRAQNNLL